MTRLANNLIQQTKNRNSINKNAFSKPLTFKYNKTKHQYGNTECGMFSMYFINEFLKNKTFINIVGNKKLNDKLVFKLRNKFFSS
jgi:hypothetical protein